MNCPKCGSQNVNAQMVTEQRLVRKRRGIFWWLFIGWWWVPIKWFCFFWIALIVKLVKPHNYKLKSESHSEFVCQSCGYHWNAEKSVSASVRQILPEGDQKTLKLRRMSADDPAVMALDDYIVLDTETTGLNPELDKIVDIALLKVSHGTVVEEYCTMVNPQQHINVKSSKIHGIYDQDVLEAPLYEEVGEKVVEFLGDCVIVGHNIKFDLDFVGKLIKTASLQRERTWTFVDTIPIAKKAFPGRDSYKLQSLVDDLGIETIGAHRARADALATFELFEMCKKKMQ